MRSWMIGGAVVVMGVAWAACSDPHNALPVAPPPSASMNAAAKSPSCDLSGTNALISRYFGSDEAKVIRGLIDAIAAAGAGTVAAKDRGFDVIAHIAANAQAGTGGDAASASTLINSVTACMFTSAAELPATFPEDYTIAITTNQAGGLGVRGGQSDPVDPVLSRDNFSGVAPQPGVTWAQMLGGNAAPARLVVYGRPGTPGQSYDWKVLPRNAAFSPAAIVGLCVDPAVATTSMLHEEHIGVLTFSEAYFLDPATCGNVSSWHGMSAWAKHLAEVLLPKPLAAATAVRGGIGGSTGGIGSDFSVNVVANVNLTFTVQPPATVTVGQTFRAQLRATDPVTGATVGGVQVSIIAVNNNGVPKTLLGTLTQTTDNSGLATFGDLQFDPSSTGGFRLVVGGKVNGRDAIVVGQATSTKVNSKPAH